jgi:hypothetical protein
MRELIQGDYAQTAKAVVSAKYNEAQINDYVLDPEVREVYDSMETQKELFAVQRGAFIINGRQNEKTEEATEKVPENTVRWSISVKAEDQREIMKNEPKVFSNLVVEKSAELKIDSSKNGLR